MWNYNRGDFYVKGPKIKFLGLHKLDTYRYKKEIKELGFDPANQKMVKGEEIPWWRNIMYKGHWSTDL